MCSCCRFPLLVGIFALLGMGITVACAPMSPSKLVALADDEKKGKDKEEKELPKAPELEGGIAWLNTGKPLKMKDLKGKFVLLDFWTLCCINCIHTLPDLAKLEKKYEKQLVVIGVHSPKFENEKDTNSIRKAILRYEVQHPVVNDADHAIWQAYRVNSWPSLALIDPEGNYLGKVSGEGNYEILDKVLTKMIPEYREKKTLDETPLRFDTAKFRESAPTPLYFPGKVIVDAAKSRLFIADSTHHRIVVTDMTGKKQAIIGKGEPGKVDGSFEKAQFDDPQGMAIAGNTLYIADRKNHCIRVADLDKQTVTTVAGTGEQDRTGRSEGFEGLKRGLNSPWDLLLIDNLLYVAMAGHHQIWTMDVKTNRMEPYAGDGGENIKDGPLFASRFAQPSGLSTDGKNLYVADCEVSAVRKLPLGGNGRVETLVGKGLFVFGDRDGSGAEEDEEKMALIQHALGVAYDDGKVYIADTYNSKIKVVDVKTREVSTFLGGKDAKGEAIFNEPAGITLSNGKLYVADTNAHRIRIVDIKTKQVETLNLQGVESK
jgi:thiol-disulfide isomerase/thioredoxin